MNERDVQKRLVKKLRRHGWHVTVFAMPHSVKRQIAGWPDVAGIRWGSVLLAEVKGPGGSLTETQLQFRFDTARHLGPRVRYVVVWPDTPLDDLVRWGAEFRPHDTEYPPKEG
jgi:hypothetical protein